MRRLASLVAATLFVSLDAGSAEVTVGSGATFDVGSATFDLGCSDLTVSGTFAAGDGSTAQIRHLIITPGGVVEGENGALEVTGDWDGSGTLNAGTGSVAFIDGCGLSSTRLFGSTTFGSVSFVSTAGKTILFDAAETQTVTGNLVMSGVPEAKLVIRSSQSGIAAFLNALGGLFISAVDVEDVHASGLMIPVDADSMLGTNVDGWFLPGPDQVPALSGGGLLLATLLIVAAGARRLRTR